MHETTHCWLTLEVGYELRHPTLATGTKATADDLLRMVDDAGRVQDLLRKHFDCRQRMRWLTGGTTPLPTADQQDGLPKDAWVGKALAIELNAAFGPKGAPSFVIDESHLLCVGRHVDGDQLQPMSGDHGTSCKLLGDRWINSRSYSISGPTAAWGLADNILLLATMTWLCPGPGDDLAGWLATTAAAARSRDAGTPGGASDSRARRAGRRRSP